MERACEAAVVTGKIPGFYLHLSRPGVLSDERPAFRQFPTYVDVIPHVLTEAHGVETLSDTVFQPAMNPIPRPKTNESFEPQSPWYRLQTILHHS